MTRLVGDGVFDGIDFEAIEWAARDLALGIVGRAVAGRLNADRSDEQGPCLLCDCGGEARFAGRREKTFTTALGPLTLERAWYHCDACSTGFSPRDRDLGLAGSSLSPAALRMVGVAAARVSFGETSDLLRDLAGLRIGPKQVERHAEALGRDIARDEHDIVVPEPGEAHTLYLGLDGTGIPVRKSETEDRQGKQADGSAKTREVKLAAVWSAGERNTDGTPERDPGSVSYTSAIESIAARDTDRTVSRFARRILRELDRRRFHDVERRVVLGDGAAWIWNFASEHLPDAVQIVDIFHAKQHLGDVAKAIYGPGTDLAAQWRKKRMEDLDRGRLDLLLTALRRHAPTCEEARKCVEYVNNNRSRMTYPKFRSMGLCVSTGVVEGACKSVIGKRMKCGGMHWSVGGANAVIALRCAVLNNRFDDYWERRADQG